MEKKFYNLGALGEKGEVATAEKLPIHLKRFHFMYRCPSEVFWEGLCSLDRAALYGLRQEQADRNQTL